MILNDMYRLKKIIGVKSYLNHFVTFGNKILENFWNVEITAHLLVHSGGESILNAPESATSALTSRNLSLRKETLC